MSHLVRYRLNLSANAWQTALAELSDCLPNILINEVDALSLLPIFAVILVIDNKILYNHPEIKHPDVLMQHWVDAHGFRLNQVKNTANAQELVALKDLSLVSNVSVFRYVLIPNRPTQITMDKRDAIAHVVDEQLSVYFKQKLKPTPNYNFLVNEQGRVNNFSLGATKTQHYMDCHIVSIAQMLRRHKLACFDMDSTLIKQEVITELAKMAGVGDEVNAITEQALRGEINFSDSFAQRVALLKGLPAEKIDELAGLLLLQTGAVVTINALKRLGYHTVLISGGFEPFAKHIASLLGVDEYHANQLDISNGKITGRVVAPILDGKEKARILNKIAEQLAISSSEIICIGDGANDLPMMAMSDIGMAYHAKPIVQVHADVAINTTGLEGVLYALGYPAPKTNQSTNANYGNHLGF